MMATEYSKEEQAFMDRRTVSLDRDIPKLNATPQRKRHPLAGKGPGVTSTSRQAFKKDVLPTIGAKQREVLVMLQMAKRPMNSQELSKYLGWPINSVTGRVKELREMEKVEEAFTDVYPATGRRTKYWKSVETAS